MYIDSDKEDSSSARSRKRLVRLERIEGSSGTPLTLRVRLCRFLLHPSNAVLHKSSSSLHVSDFIGL